MVRRNRGSDGSESGRTCSEENGPSSGARPSKGSGVVDGRHIVLTVLLTLVMSWSMLQLFAVAALAPMMGPDLGIGPSVLGGAVGAGFAVAALLSPWAGKLVDRWGPRRCTVGLLLLVAVALGLLAVSRGGVGLALALVVNGFPQALANPATNKVILVSVPATRRSGVIGWKQSGVQMGALVAGLPLVWVAMWLGWRVAFVVAAVVAILLAVWALGVLPRGERVGPASPVAWQGAGMVRLAFFSLFLGVGVSSVNSHLALFSTSTLGMSSVQAGALVAILGAAGVVGRIFWTGRASRWGAGRLLTPLAAGAVLGPVLLWASPWVTSLVWVAALFVGGVGVAANAVSMVSVIARSSAAAVGSATAVVSAGFFAGYAVGPPVLGALAEAVSYQQAWWWPGLSLMVAAVVMAPFPRKEERGTR